MNAEPTPYERVHYDKLVGWSITGIRWEDFEGRPLPVLVLGRKKPKAAHAMVGVMCDPEGNGPGHLEHSL